MSWKNIAVSLSSKGHELKEDVEQISLAKLENRKIARVLSQTNLQAKVKQEEVLKAKAKAELQARTAVEARAKTVATINKPVTPIISKPISATPVANEVQSVI